MNKHTFLKRLFFIVILSTFVVSCNSKKSENYVDKQNTVFYEDIKLDEAEKTASEETNLDGRTDLLTTESSVTATPPPPPSSENEIIENLEIETKLIKTASITIELKDYEENKFLIDTMVSKYSGYISGENEIRNDMMINNNLIIRVPCENFDNLIENIISISTKVDSKLISVEDVTDQYVDVYTRLQTKKLVEQQYLEILKKAYTITDILNVTEHIRQIREEIDAKEGELKYLDNQVSLSTINLYIYENVSPDVVKKNNFWKRLINSLEKGWNGILIFILGLFQIWPVWLIFSIILFFVIKKIRKKKNNN